MTLYLKKNSETLFLVLGIILAAFGKVWLVHVQALSAAGGAMHDEYLFIRTASAVLNGNWLGPYDYLTLIKGPFYPLWIALNHILGIPLLFSQHLLYIFASLALVWALVPVLPGWKSTLLLFVVLLFNPMSFAGEIMPRVMREGIYPALTMLCFAGAIGLFLRSDQFMASSWPWSLIMVFSLPAFWLTREEGIWIIPGMMILHLATCWKFYNYLKNEPHGFRKTRFLKICIMAGMPYVALLICISAVKGLNYHHYGIFTVVEIKSRPFTSAYAALSRVAYAETRRYVPVPAETRQKIYAVSPTFEKLHPYLEGPVGQKWIGYVCAAVPTENIDHDSEFYRYIDLIEIACDDLAGGWFIWALRDSAAAAGFHCNALKAQRFYAQLANEVNESCDNGNIRCFDKRNSLIPNIDIKYFPFIVDSLAQGIVYLFSFKNFSATPLPSWGTLESISLVAHVTGNKLFFPDKDKQQPQDKIRMKILEGIGKIYQKAAPWAGLFLLCSPLILFFTFWKNPFTFPFFIMWLSLVVAIMTRLFMLAIIDTCSFPAISAQYLSPIYPLMLCLCYLSMVFVGLYTRRKIDKL